MLLIVDIWALLSSEKRLRQLICSWDLYHLEIAFCHYKNWSVPDSLTYLKSYMKELSCMSHSRAKGGDRWSSSHSQISYIRAKTIFLLDSFVKTRTLTEDVIEGWRLKVMG